MFDLMENAFPKNGHVTPENTAAWKKLVAYTDKISDPDTIENIQDLYLYGISKVSRFYGKEGLHFVARTFLKCVSVLQVSELQEFKKYLDAKVDMATAAPEGIAGVITHNVPAGPNAPAELNDEIWRDLPVQMQEWGRRVVAQKHAGQPLEPFSDEMIKKFQTADGKVMAKNKSFLSRMMSHFTRTNVK